MPYWKLVKDEGPVEWDGKHSVFVDTVNYDGERITGVPVLFYWNDGNQRKSSEEKRGEEFAMDFPMFAAGAAYSVKIDDGNPGDIKQGMGLIAFKPHVSYKLVFKLVSSDEQAVTPPAPGHDSIEVRVNGVVVWKN